MLSDCLLRRHSHGTHYFTSATEENGWGVGVEKGGEANPLLMFGTFSKLNVVMCYIPILKPAVMNIK